MDDELRTQARTLRAGIERELDIEAAWREFGLIESGLEGVSPRGRDSQRPRWLLGVAAVTAGLVAAATAYVASRPEEILTEEPPSTSVPLTTSPSPSTVAPSPTPAPTPPATPPVTVPTTQPGAAGSISISYLSPPPPATPSVFASAPGTGKENRFVLGELGALEQSFGVVSIYGFDGSVRTVQLDPSLADVRPVAFGPGDVMYGIVQSSEPPWAPFPVAIALGGEHAGAMLAQGEGSIAYLETPPIAFAHGPIGVTLVREPGHVLMGYVDELGAPLTWEEAPRAVAARSDADLVTAGDGAWQLAIERHPDGDRGDSLTGPNGVAAGPGGTYIHATTIGPRTEPDIVYLEFTMSVIATMSPDGTGRWDSIPDGWHLQSISPWGVLVSRLDPSTSVHGLALLGATAPMPLLLQDSSW